MFSQQELMRYIWLVFLPLLGFSTPLRVEVQAPAVILINATTGQILYEKNAHALRNPASTTKVATGWFALEKMGHRLNDEIVVAPNLIKLMSAATRQGNLDRYPPYQLEIGGSSANLKPGEKATLSTLLYGLMLVSGNDAANVIANYVSGSVDQFMLQLNAFLKSKGIQNTNFRNPHGLYYPDHQTTAYDMAQIARLAMQNAEFRKIVGTVSYTKPDSKQAVPVVWQNHMRLLRPGKFFYPKATGIKTGYIASAGYNAVTSAENEERKLIAVVMGAKTSEERFKDAIALFEKAFAEKKIIRKLFTKEYDQFSTAVEGAEGVLKAHLLEDLSLEYFPSEEPEFKVAIEWQKMPFPILEGVEVGKLRIVTDHKKLLLEQPIYAQNTLKGTFSHRFFYGISVFLSKYKTLVIVMGMLLVIGGLLYYRIRKAAEARKP